MVGTRPSTHSAVVWCAILSLLTLLGDINRKSGVIEPLDILHLKIIISNIFYA